MGNSLSFSRSVHLLLAGVFVFQLSNCEVWAADSTSPFPVLGTASVPEGHWNEIPDLELKLSESVAEDPLRFQLISSAGEEYFSQTLLDESHKQFQKLLKAKKPSPSEYTQKMSAMRLAEINLLQGHADDAIKSLGPLTQDSNAYISEESIFLVGRCYLAKRDWSDMDKTVNILLHKNIAYSEDLALNLMRSVAAIEQSHPDEALVYLKKYPNEPSALYYSGVCYIKKKEISNALPLYQQILQKDQHSEWVDRMRLSLGEAFYTGNDLTLAQDFFKPVTRPQAETTLRPLALHRMACIYFQQKKFDQCDRVLTDLLKQYPHHSLRTQWTYLYASIPIFNKDYKKAIQEQKMALEFERGMAPRVHGVDVNQLRQSSEFRITWAHLLLNDYNGARILSDKFIGEYPKEQITSYAYLAKGLALYRMGDYDRALEVYQQLLNNFPDSSADGKAVYLMTLCLHSARDPFRMAGILNEIHNRMAKVSADSTQTVDEWTQNTLYWVADAYYQLNDLTNAEKIYKEFILRAPQSPLIPYALEGLASALSAQGPARDGEALVALQQALLRARDLNYKEFAEEVQIELAKVYYNQRDFSKAASSWNELVQSSTNTAIRSEALFRQADALSHQEYYQEAIKRWQLLAHNFKDSVWVPDALMRIGNTQSGLGDWAAAAATFNVLKTSYPNSTQGKEGAFQLVQCAFNEGNLPQSVTALLSFSKQYPDDARISKAADNLLSSFRQKKVTISAADQAALLKLAPGSAGGASLLWERGAALFNEAKYETAQKLFEKIMLSYPNDEYAPLAYFYDADCFFWLQKWDEAANAYQNFYVAFPKHERVPNAMFQRAVCLFRKGVYDDAVTGFKDFLHRFPDHPLAKEAWLNIALAHKKAFQLDQAIWAYKYVIAHYPNDPKINAVWVQMGSLYEVQGKLSDAQQAYAKVSTTTPESAEATYHRAMIFDQQHNTVDSVKLLEEVRNFPEKKNEFRQAALIKLSEIYEQQGASASKLRALYQDLAASSTDPEIAKQAQQRLQEIK